jgi:hypothetical protein
MTYSLIGDVLASYTITIDEFTVDLNIAKK